MPTAPMNLLLVNWQDPENPRAGGAEQHLFALFGRLARRGHRVRLVCSGWPGAAPRAVVDGVEVTRIGGRHTFALLGRGAVRRALAESRPDVLVEDVNKIPLYTATLSDVPALVIVPHLFGTAAFAEAPWPMAAIVWLSERGLAPFYRRAEFHAISESTRHDLIERGVAPERIVVVHPGVESTAFTPDPSLPRTDPPTFLYIGRLQRYKGVHTALRALVEVRRRVPGVRFAVAGVGPQRAELDALVAELGLGDAVTFHGFVDEATKLRLLRTAVANVFPSCKEGWGITVMEAAACGTPSIAADVPGLRDSVRDGETGLLFPHDDVAALAARMLALAGDPGKVAMLGNAARRWAEAHDWEAAADALERQLARLAGRPAQDALAGASR